MKKIFWGIMGMMGMMGMMGCDRIEEGEYTVYDGAVVTWTETDATLTPVQRAYVEKYTGPRCSNCPRADETLAAIEDSRVVVVSVNHPTGQGIPYPNQPDLRTDGGTAWDQYFGINAIPAAYLNRQGTQFQGDMGTIASAINQALGEEAKIAIEASASASAGKVSITVNMQFAEGYANAVTLTAAIVEDSLKYKQLLPDGTVDDNYMHNHMLRKVITGFWGRDVERNSGSGNALCGTLSFTPASEINLANSHIVVFVSDKSSRKVLNCASCKIMVND